MCHGLIASKESVSHIGVATYYELGLKEQYNSEYIAVHEYFLVNYEITLKYMPHKNEQFISIFSIDNF